MGDLHQDVTEAELAVFQALWDAGPATIRQLVERVYRQTERRSTRPCRSCSSGSRRRGASVATAAGPVHVFRAVVDRDELIGRRLRAVADSLCGGSLPPL